ncbi:phage major capsid protein [Leuconostoc suionicum]|uniref:phage major capsid protein n=1 Tax=Leuconostoc suionicum TaxID=1511761 RepID=UPI00233E9362|nr:phage major capsid protein [Leuconostoc suionicum]MDC2815438.1 phage major capsid protein [Leuconostoc suionicum]
MVKKLTQTVEIRAKTEEKRHLLSGYAIVFNSSSENMGFIETVDSNALNNVDLSNVFALYNHDFDNVLGKTGKNLSLSIDKKGLSFSLELLPEDERIYQLVKEQIINKMSFGFVVQDDEWQDETHRTIKSIKALQEISLVPIPAYEGTDIIAKRSLEMSEKTDETEQETQPDLQAEIDELKKQIMALQPDDSDDEAESKEQPDDSATNEADDVEDEDKEKETRNMQTFNKTNNEVSEEVRSFENYLKNGEKRGLNTMSGHPIIPQELQKPQFQPQASTGLLSLVNTQITNTNVGSLPVVKHATSGFAMVTDEGSDVPETDAPSIIEVDYHLNLFSGNVPVTYQLANSSDNATDIVMKHITAKRDKTRMEKIGALLQHAAAKTVSNIDDLKAIANSDDLVDYSDKAFVVTSDFYNWLDTQKTTDGAYLLQPSIIEGAQKTLFGHPLYQVKNATLGGGSKAFFGNVSDFALEVINSQLIFTYQENRNLSTVAVGGVFADWQVADSDAGVFISYSEASKG